MKYVALTFTALLVLGFAAAPAQAGSFSLYGAYLDTEDLAESVGGGATWGIPLGSDALELELRATYFPDLTENFSSFVDDPGDDPGSFTNDISAVPVDIGVVYNFGAGAPLNFYLGGGGSYYFLDAERGEVDDEFGFYGVGGVEWTRPGSGFGLFAEAIFRNIEGTVKNEPQDFDDLDDIEFDNNFLERDLDVGGFGINAGIVWRF